MDDHSLSIVAQQLNRLEREHRHLKRVGALVVIGLATVTLMGQATPGKVAKVIEAEKFVLREATGKERATLELRPYGSVALALADGNGGRQAIMEVSADGEPKLWLMGEDGKSAANLEVIAGLPQLTLRGKDGQVRAALGLLLGVGQPLLQLNDENGGHGADLGLSLDGSRFLAFYDESGHVRSVLRVFSKGGSGLALIDKKGGGRAWLTLASDGSPSLILQDENGKERAVLGHTGLKATRTGTVEQRPASSLVLLDKDGKVLWSAP